MDIAELPLVGGHVALDLANTLDWDDARHDYLGTGEDLVVWFARSPLSSPNDAASIAPTATTEQLERIRELRSALRSLLLAQMGVEDGTPMDPTSALRLVSSRAAVAAARSSLSLAPGGGPLVRIVGTEPDHLIEDRLADSTLELLTSPELSRLRRCPIDQGGCGWMFLDRSKNSSRTWCRMEDCGNQAKARRLTERRRTERAKLGASETP
jgi:predicted RNA-binding Zn ribbon-like protein